MRSTIASWLNILQNHARQKQAELAQTPPQRRRTSNVAHARSWRASTIGMVWNKKVKTKRGILSGQAAYNAWLSGGIDSINITRDTLILRDLLQERYPGLLVYSLSPFIGLGLEGHKFTHARI